MATIQEIAKAAGVSAMTVSRVLNKRNKEAWPSAAKRAARIRKIATDMGYRPNTAARAMSTGRFGSAALLIPKNRQVSHLPMGVLSGVQDALAERNMHLTIAEVQDEALTSESFLPKILREWLADGLLINYHYRIPPRMLEIVHRFHMPSVWLNAKMHTDAVYPDEPGGGRLGCEYLLGLGHRRIVYVDYSHGWAAMPDAHFSASERALGYELAMRAAGLPPTVIRSEGKSVPYIERQAFSLKLIEAEGRPTAFIGYAPDSVSPISVAAAMRGLTVPADLSLMAFSEYTSHEMGPRQTTICEPVGAMGREAVGMLLERIARPAESVAARTIPHDLDEGSTCAPPRA